MRRVFRQPAWLHDAGLLAEHPDLIVVLPTLGQLDTLTRLILASDAAPLTSAASTSSTRSAT